MGSGVADNPPMTSSFDSNGPERPTEDFPPIDDSVAAERLEQEAGVYLEVGQFFLSNPAELGNEILLTWFTDVALSSRERRWGTLEMLAMYGLSAVNATGGLSLTEEQKTALIASVATDGPLRAELEHAARDAIDLLQSGMDPASELPSQWAIYREVLPDTFKTVCLVFAVLTLETVRQVAAQDEADPAALWRDWLQSRSAA